MRGELKMNNVIKGLKPEAIWRYFCEISQIPRESKNEKEVAEYIISVAKKLNLPYKQDELGNVLVSKPASPGHEKAPAVCLQGHLDMVCEKNRDTVHDFLKDPIRLLKDGDFITADGTTLGADNGIGVAAELAIMEAKDMVHPPMEFLFTIDEETGLTGANGLKEGFLKAKTLINCDSEEDGALYVGCAGGKDTSIKFDIDWVTTPEEMKAVTVKITGLKGGHSGLDIALGRANANKQLNRVIWNVAEKFNIKLFSINGGSKHNAIPREADYMMLIPETEFDAFKNLIREYEATLKTEFKGIEPDLKFIIEENAEYPARVFSADFQSRILNLIYALPHGVIGMSPDIPDLVETSTSLAIIETEDDNLSILTSQRSSVATEIIDIADKVKATGLLAGGDVHQGGGYPGWSPNMDSKILKFMKETYKDLFGKEPEVKAIHAGLECGIIGEKTPGMDMISFGPTIISPHSPGERVQISTVEKFWILLKETLKRIAEG